MGQGAEASNIILWCSVGFRTTKTKRLWLFQALNPLSSDWSGYPRVHVRVATRAYVQFTPPATQLHVKTVILVGPAHNGVCSFPFPAIVEPGKLIHILIESPSPASPTRHLPLRRGFLRGSNGTYRTRLCYCIATAACRSSADPLVSTRRRRKVPHCQTLLDR